MRKLLPYLLVCSALFCAPSAFAKGVVIGLGNKPCSEYAKKDSYKKNEWLYWVQGYVTGFNQESAKTDSLTAGKDFYWVRDYLDKYCGENPKTSFGDAAKAMAADLAK